MLHAQLTARKPNGDFYISSTSALMENNTLSWPEAFTFLVKRELELKADGYTVDMCLAEE